MRTQELDTKSAGFYAYAAARDASMKSYAASTHYTDAQRTQAQRMRFALELVYNAKGIYVTFRKKFVVVKVDAAFIRDMQELKALEAAWSRQGITKVKTAQAVAYRLPKV
jgi:hypothetical protein